MKKYSKVMTILIQAVLALATTVALAQISHYGITGIELLLPCVFALCFIVYNKATAFLKREHAKDIGIALGVGMIAAIAAVIGSHIDMEEHVFNSVGLMDVIYILFIIPLFMGVFLLLFFRSDACNRIKSEAGVEVVFSKKRFFIYCGVMLLCWLPYYLTYYPGGVGNDDFECVRMCLGAIPLTNHHPVFFTFILKFYITVARLINPANYLTLAFGIMSGVQMLTLACTLSAVLMWMNKRMGRHWFVVISLAFFALHPIVAMYSIYVTKDVYFAEAVVFLILFLMDFMKNSEGEKFSVKNMVILGVLSFLTIITRNNGTMMIAVLAVVMLLLCRHHWQYVLLTFGIVFALNGIYKGPVWKSLHIEKQSFAEAASIPLSQVAYTIQQNGVISDEDLTYLEQLMPIERVKLEYEPGYTDSYKFSPYFDKQLLDENPGDFMKVWLHMLPSNFGKYVEVYLMQTSGYWYYGMTNTVATEGVQPNELGIEGTDLIERICGMSVKGILPRLVLVARKLPILCMFSQMAVMLLAILLCTITAVRYKDWSKLVVLSPLLALWLSIMIATPAYCLFRYMFPVFLLWPIMIDYIFAISDRK